jgi:hypothetical protein
MPRRMTTHLLLFAWASLAWQATAEAQVRLDVGPTIGLYAPVGDFRPAAYYSTALPASPQDLAGFAFGAQGRLWLAPRVGVQVEGAVVSRHVGGGATPGGLVPATAARVFTSTLQLLYSLSAPASRPRVWLSAGGALVHHGGAAYAPYRGRTDLGGVVGLGSAIAIRPRLSVTAGLGMLVYQMALRDSQGILVEHGAQVDVRLQAGLTWSWP